MAKLTLGQTYENLERWCYQTECDKCPLGNNGDDSCQDTWKALDEYLKED